MSAKVTLTITAGDLEAREYIFEERTTCIIGRSEDCQIKMPEGEKYRSISRYHCLLDINPPSIRVRDFGSKNGTYINSLKIGQRDRSKTPEDAAQTKFPERDLKAGDEIKVGKATFKVNIDIPTETIQENPATLKVARETVEDRLAIRGYKIIRKLGVGGNGEVYLAQHEETGDRVALKVMLPQIASQARNIEQFRREAHKTRALNHPHIVQLKEEGYSDETFFFTLEYCENGSLADLMQQRGGRLSTEEAVAIIMQVLEGLESAHNTEIDNVKLADGSMGKGRGLIHRDLKPSNILLTNNNSVAKIADYGLSKAFDLAGLRGLSVTGSYAGMPYFLPRQQVIDFKYASPAMDVWAAAAVLYYAIAGTYPRDFTGQDPWLAVLQSNAVPILRRDPSIPVPLAQAIDLALLDKPEIHFQTAAAFKQALSQATRSAS